MKNKITVLVSTYKRYDSTLPICLLSLANQSRKPDRIVLVDDNVEKRFYESTELKNIISYLKLKDIQFDYYHGQSKGATFALQIGLDKINNGWILKIDDDNCIEYNVLELFEKNIKDNVGAIGGIILDKNIRQNIEKNLFPKCINGYYNKIENIFSEFNIQLINNQSDEIKKVEHLYSNYFFRRELVDNYPTELAPSCHREDTIVTHTIFKKGYDLLMIPQAKIYHLNSHEKSGDGKWENKIIDNEFIFIDYLKKWNIIPNKLKIIEKNKILYAISNENTFLITK